MQGADDADLSALGSSQVRWRRWLGEAQEGVQAAQRDAQLAGRLHAPREEGRHRQLREKLATDMWALCSSLDKGNIKFFFPHALDPRQETLAQEPKRSGCPATKGAKGTRMPGRTRCQSAHERAHGDSRIYASRRMHRKRHQTSLFLRMLAQLPGPDLFGAAQTPGNDTSILPAAAAAARARGRRGNQQRAAPSPHAGEGGFSKRNLHRKGICRSLACGSCSSARA